MLGIQIYPRNCHKRFHPSVLRNDCSLRVHRLFNDCVKVRSWIVKVQPQRKVCFLNSPHHTLKISFLFRLCIIYICTCSGRNFKETIPLSIITGSCDTNPNPYFPHHVMVLVLFSLSCDTIGVNFLLSSSQFTRTFARAEDEVSKKLLPWVSSRDLH